MKFHIIPQRRPDAALLDPLLDRTFGLARRKKTVYRLREGVDPIPELSFVAVAPEGELLGSIRFWPVLIAAEPSLLLGPFAVEPELQGLGIGRALIRHGLDAARQGARDICVLVGDPAYYGPFGFTEAEPLGLVLPGPVEPGRFQVLELVPGRFQSNWKGASVLPDTRR